MSRFGRGRPAGRDVLEEHAVERGHVPAAGRPARRVRGRRARVLPPARALGARRGRAVDARAPPGGAAPRRRPGRDGARGPRGAARRATCSSSSPSGAEGRSWYGEPGAAELREWAPVLLPRRRARLARARRPGVPRARGARPRARGPRRRGADASSRPTARRSGPGSSTCARTCSAARSTTCARSPPRAAAWPRAVDGVVGSINLDLVARCERLPRPGETVTGATFDARSRRQGREPGGRRGPARRRGADSSAAVGDDELRATEALHDARARRGVDAGRCIRVDEPTGVALILVDAAGENQIVVAPGANAHLRPERRRPRGRATRVLCQLEIPLEAVAAAASRRRVLLPQRCAGQAACRASCSSAPTCSSSTATSSRRSASRRRPVALTLGAEGAVLLEDGEEVARAEPPPRRTPSTARPPATRSRACLAVSLLEGRPREEALRRACAAGALAASRFGAQPSLPTAAEVDAILAARMTTPILIDCDPGPRRRDRAPARAREPGARAARRDDRLRQPDAREDDRERAPRARVRRPRRRAGRRGRRPAARPRAVRRRVRPRRERPRRARPAAAAAARPVEQHAVDFLAERVAGADAGPGRPADERRRSCSRCTRRRGRSSGSC